jgi:hypothetical protein
MGFKRSAGVCRLLHARRTTSSDDLLNRALWALGDFTARSASCEGGSSIAGILVAGVAAANLFAFSSSLRRKQKIKPFVEVNTKIHSV